MTATGRIRSEATAAGRSFRRRRTAVFFTFLFPALLVIIFGALVETRPTGGGLFAEPAEYYVAGYLAVVVLFTPLSRVGSEVARHRSGARFEKLATTPLTRTEWLLAHSLVNVVVVGLASGMIVGLVVVLTDATVRVTPAIVLLVPFVVAGATLFCAIGAMLGRVADSQDGVVAASNAVALPLLFLSETFVPPSLLPDWLPTGLSPLTYFARGVRSVTTASAGRDPLAIPPLGLGFDLPLRAALGDLAVLTLLAIVAVVIGARAIPRTD